MLKREVEVAMPEFVDAEVGEDFPEGMEGGRVETAQASQLYGYGEALSVKLKD